MILLTILRNWIFLTIYADDNTLSAFADTIHELIQILQSESEIAIKWFNDIKFQAIIIDKENKGKLNSHNLKFGN